MGRRYQRAQRRAGHNGEPDETLERVERHVGCRRNLRSDASGRAADSNAAAGQNSRKIQGWRRSDRSEFGNGIGQRLDLRLDPLNHAQSISERCSYSLAQAIGSAKRKPITEPNSRPERIRRTRRYRRAPAFDVTALQLLAPLAYFAEAKHRAAELAFFQAIAFGQVRPAREPAAITRTFRRPNPDGQLLRRAKGWPAISARISWRNPAAVTGRQRRRVDRQSTASGCLPEKIRRWSFRPNRRRDAYSSSRWQSHTASRRRSRSCGRSWGRQTSRRP
jgi:hypothetical protein